MRGQFLTIFKPQNKYVSGVLTAEEYAKTAWCYLGVFDRTYRMGDCHFVA
jgi:hypothetical protein